MNGFPLCKRKEFLAIRAPFFLFQGLVIGLPLLEHYGSVVDLYVRARLLLDDTLNFISIMPMKPRTAALLNSCKMYKLLHYVSFSEEK